MNATDRPVNGPDGFYGTIDTTCWLSIDDKTLFDIDLQLSDTDHVAVPADALIEQKDGSFYLPLHRRDLKDLPHHRAGQSPADTPWPCLHRRPTAPQPLKATSVNHLG